MQHWVGHIRKARLREAPGATASVSSRADGAKKQVIASPGAPLPAADRQWFGSRLGADLSSVRVHSDSAAARSAEELDARAYTTGAHIVFGRGEYAPRAVQRWAIGTALPAGAPAGWQLVPADHLPRLAPAEADIRSVLGSRTCRSYFEGYCTGRTAASLQNAFDNAVIFHRNTNDDTFGGQLGTSSNISCNSTAHRIGHWFMASTLPKTPSSPATCTRRSSSDASPRVVRPARASH